MKQYQIISRLSIILMFVFMVQIFFFKKYFSPEINKLVLYALIICFIIFPIVEILKRREIKKNENKYLE